MCGISGIIKRGNKPVLQQDIKAMNDLIFHRGPDDEGYFFGEAFALGHRRLAILDLSSDGHQPMHYLDKYVITYNGEIYNYLEIRDELMRDGFRFHSKTDTEVILAAYDKWGFDCVKKFNGMWAFSLFDREKNLLFCSRDRFGVKPFYYSDDEDTFVFGSEIKQVICNRHGRIFANVNSVRDFLVEGYSEHTEETFFEGVFSLPPGNNLIYSIEHHTFSREKYYLLEEDKSLSLFGEEAAAARFLENFKRSINYRLRSDVKVGTCLSGGLDSSSVAGIAAKIYADKSEARFQAIHAKTKEMGMDESQHAEELASTCNIDLCIIEPTTEEFRKSIHEVVYCQEEPFRSPSVFMQYFVFKKAKELGCKVMLDGQGGDEILLGYERYFPAYLRALPFSSAIKAFFNSSKNSRLSLNELLAYFAYFSIPTLRMARIKIKFSFLKDEHLKDFSKIKRFSESYLDIRKLQKLEIESLQLPHLLRYEDKNSMWHSIEARLPFLDYQLVETALSINNAFKIKDGWTKYILRKAMAGLIPNSILWRKNKIGFAAPEEKWTKGIHAEMRSTIASSALLKHMSKRRVDLNKIDQSTYWKLYSIAKWEYVYNVKFRLESQVSSDVLPTPLMNLTPLPKMAP